MRRTIFPCYDADSWAYRVNDLPIQNVDHFRFSNHDRKPVEPDLQRLVKLLHECGRPWRWASANPPVSNVSLTLMGDTLICRGAGPATVTPIFGEPFVAVETTGGQVVRVNARRESDSHWTIDRPPRVNRLVVAVNMPDGRTGIAR
jgi:hypothetical protein